MPNLVEPVLIRLSLSLLCAGHWGPMGINKMSINKEFKIILVMLFYLYCMTLICENTLSTLTGSIHHVNALVSKNFDL